ncbi:MAG: hypothetical protein HOH74_10115 [Gemmatimonadetes bacterium]|nr:hypothetical protein [Gemmatimonadota bacterium]
MTVSRSADRVALWDREGGVEDFAWDSASGSIVYGSLRSSSRHLFLYRPVQDLWCSIPGTGELNASTPTWLVPERSLVFSGRTGGRRLYRIDLGN